jgi:hypothetical protein
MSAPVRKAAFYHRGPEDENLDSYLGCPECGHIIDHIPSDWLDIRVGEHLGCPNCGLSSRIPTFEEASWPYLKHPQDTQFMVPVPEREAERLPSA